MDMIRRTLQVTLVGAIAMVVPWTEARAEERAVGIVTTLEGAATVARASLPQPAALKFKDQVFVRDRIVTGDSAVVRILLGGKATVTARERSVLVISEGPGTSTISLSYGQIAVAVVKSRMNPGESVEIRTPNAVAAVRGTVVIAEVPVRADRSTITVLRGLVDVIRLTTAGRAIGPVTSVGVQQRVTVTDAVSSVKAITREEAKRITTQFSVTPKTPSAGAAAPLVQAAVERGAREIGALERGAAVNGSAPRLGEKSEKSEKSESGSGSSAAGGGGVSGASSGGGTGGGSPAAPAVAAPAAPAVTAPAPVGGGGLSAPAAVAAPAAPVVTMPAPVSVGASAFAGAASSGSGSSSIIKSVEKSVERSDRIERVEQQRKKK
ncbi:MAG: FecR domain-containing protein [Candidatus Rokubacteria bacterium]|nr:FecR domain-containing protein [Candidatus Rokubacteria bacterium]MBI2155481.1 FecR domain-containing protein [Candidatus Rokubacteria bacterium]